MSAASSRARNVSAMGSALGLQGLSTGAGDTRANRQDGLCLAQQPITEPLASFVSTDCASYTTVHIRSQWVMLETDLARLCRVLPQRLSERSRPHKDSFEPGEMFQLTPAEKAECVAKIGRLSKLRFSVALPYVYSESGAVRLVRLMAMPLAHQHEVEAELARAFASARQPVGPGSPPCTEPQL